MAIYAVNLDALAQASLRAQRNRSLDINWDAVLAYRAWVKDQLTGASGNLQNQVDQAIASAMQQLLVLMPGGVDQYVKRIAVELAKLGAAAPREAPIVPIINNELKSDAWLTGLVHNHIVTKWGYRARRSSTQVFAVKRTGVIFTPEALPKPVVQWPCKVVLIDDASYSGTQATEIVFSAIKGNLYDKNRVVSFWVLLDGISQRARDYFEAWWQRRGAEFAPHPKPQFFARRTIPSGDFGSRDVMIAMRKLPCDPSNATVSQGWYNKHCEVDQSTLSLKSMSVLDDTAFTFQNISYAILPYKIPDSLSVPTHVLMACGYKAGRLNLPTLSSWAGAGYVDQGEQLPATLPHLFTVSGSTNYREALADWNRAAGIGNNQSIFSAQLTE
jgi:hypothetical protein